MRLIINHLAGLICFALLMACSTHTDPRVAFDAGDYEASYKLWLPLAEQGDAEAQNYLGIHHYLGLGVNRDLMSAAKWYGLAAKQGYADAQRNYGNMFYEGTGVRQDFYTAYIWYFAASRQGNENAKRQLDDLSSQNKLTPNQQMHAKIKGNEFITDAKLRFLSHDTYIDTDKKLSH